MVESLATMGSAWARPSPGHHRKPGTAGGPQADGTVGMTSTSDKVDLDIDHQDTQAGRWKRASLSSTGMREPRSWTSYHRGRL